MIVVAMGIIPALRFARARRRRRHPAPDPPAESGSRARNRRRTARPAAGSATNENRRNRRTAPRKGCTARYRAFSAGSSAIFRDPGHRHSRRGLRVRGLRLARHQDRAARLGAQMPRVLGQVRQQQQQRQIGRTGRRHQRGERLTAIGHGRQRPGPRRPQQFTGLESRSQSVVCHFLFTSRPRCATIGWKRWPVIRCSIGSMPQGRHP